MALKAQLISAEGTGVLDAKEMGKKLPLGFKGKIYKEQANENHQVFVQSLKILVGIR